MTRTMTAALFALAATAAPALAQAVVSINTSAGQALAAAGNNMTLYTFTQDSTGTSNCYDSCAASWPPFLASAGASPQGGLTLVTRRDGAQQWALNGQPLYFWQGDRAPGDATGHGVGGVWFIAEQ